MRVLITGGTGFIGSRLAVKCLERGDSVRIFSQVNTPTEQANKNFIESIGAEFVQGSMTEKEKLQEITNDIDVVFHLAAAQHEANVPDQHFWDVNVEGTRNLLDACVGKGINRFVHGSTIGVYGSLNGPITEKSPCAPDNIYGVTKLEGEKLVLSYKDKLSVVAIRICETYGPGDRRLLKLFKGIRKKMFFMIGPGDNLHHLIYVDDLIQGFFLAVEKEKAKGEVFLFSDDTPVNSNKMAEIIAADLAVPQPRFRAPLWPFMAVATLMEKTLKPLGIQPPLHRRRMNFFIKSFSLSNQKAKKLLGFNPRFSFANGVAETSSWYEEHGLFTGNDGSPARDQDTASVMGNNLEPSRFQLTALTEPFDSFWEGPQNLEKGYDKFGKFYRHNYLHFVPKDKNINILAVGCGPGYFVNLLREEGYQNILGIDSFAEKIAYAKKRNLNCKVAHGFDYLKEHPGTFDFIFGEQEINHLTKEEIVQFLELAHSALKEGGTLIIHSLNGANPITGSEALAQNFDHYNTFTDYSLTQVLKHTKFRKINIFPLKLYIFYENPFNYVGIVLDFILSLLFRAGFIFYGKSNKIFTKKIAAIARKTKT